MRGAGLYGRMNDRKGLFWNKPGMSLHAVNFQNSVPRASLCGRGNDRERAFSEEHQAITYKYWYFKAFLFEIFYIFIISNFYLISSQKCQFGTSFLFYVSCWHSWQASCWGFTPAWKAIFLNPFFLYLFSSTWRFGSWVAKGILIACSHCLAY